MEREEKEEVSTGAVLPELSHFWPRWRGFYEEHLRVPGCLAKAPSSVLGTTCVIFSTHLSTHAVGKLQRDLSDLQGKRQGDGRCSEAERERHRSWGDCLGLGVGDW